MSANAGIPDDVKLKVVVDRIEKILEPYSRESQRRILAAVAIIFGFDEVVKELLP